MEAKVNQNGGNRELKWRLYQIQNVFWKEEIIITVEIQIFVEKTQSCNTVCNIHHYRRY